MNFGDVAGQFLRKNITAKAVRDVVAHVRPRVGSDAEPCHEFQRDPNRREAICKICGKGREAHK
jgi:hypothetical protein